MQKDELVMNNLYIPGPSSDQFKFEGCTQNINFKECEKCNKKICISDNQIKKSEQKYDTDVIHFFCLKCFYKLYKKEKGNFEVKDVAKNNPQDSDITREIFEDIFK